MGQLFVCVEGKKETNLAINEVEKSDHHRNHSRHGRGRGNEEHHDLLVADCDQGISASENLPCEHPRNRDQPHYRHGIQGRQHRRTQGLHCHRAPYHHTTHA